MHLQSHSERKNGLEQITICNTLHYTWAHIIFQNEDMFNSNNYSIKSMNKQICPLYSNI